MTAFGGLEWPHSGPVKRLAGLDVTGISYIPINC